MEQHLSGAPIDGQGAGDVQDAPVVDTTGGQGGEGEDGKYAGFNTPEELVSDYESKVGELSNLQTQVKNLESLKGRHGNEIYSLRQQIASLTGQIEGMKSAAPQAPQGPSIDDIAAKLDSGEIDESQAIKMAYQAANQDAETRLGQKFQQMLESKIGELQQQTAHERYVEKFLSQNPGYEEAYNGGKLDQWLNQGLTGEQAWDKYQLEATKSELQTLKQQAKDAAKAAEENGLNKGIQLEKAKTTAGRVLTGKGGQYSATTGNYDLNDPAQRRQAAIERLKQLRGGG